MACHHHFQVSVTILTLTSPVYSKCFCLCFFLILSFDELLPESRVLTFNQANLQQLTNILSHDQHHAGNFMLSFVYDKHLCDCLLCCTGKLLMTSFVYDKHLCDCLLCCAGKLLMSSFVYDKHLCNCLLCCTGKLLMSSFVYDKIASRCSPQASYDRRRHRNCFPTRPA